MTVGPKNSTVGETTALASELRSQGQLRDAEQLYFGALRSTPNDFDALHGLGTVYLDAGRPAQAQAFLTRAIAVNATSADAQSDLGVALHALGHIEEALVPLRTAAALAPENAVVRNNLGNILAGLNRYLDAVTEFEHAIALKPDYSTARFNLANALLEVGRVEDAAAQFRVVLESGPDVEAQIGLGACLQALDHPEDAQRAFEKVLSIDPRNAQAHHGIGVAHQTLGNMQSALAAFEAATQFAPAMPAYHRALSGLKKYKPGDRQLATMEALMRRSAQMGDPMKTDLHFALAKAYDDLGRTGDAFRHLRDGNALKRRSVAYDENTTFEDWHRIKMIFSAEFLRDRCRSEVSAQSPVFVVGMPRSGSTLVEQMLASHPDVFGAGEVSYLEDSIGTLCDGDVRFPGIVQTMSRTDLTTFGDRYVELLQSRAPFATRVTDKMLGNFRFLGLIYLALPHARIIHVQRNPVDTCFSCFAKLFSGDIPFSYDLSELGRYYRAYESLMAHWRHALPETAMLEVRYENLVADFEKEARRIVSYCGLGWDPRCLAFHATRRAVRTASAEQVRRPLYSDAVGRAEVYGPALDPLRKALNGEVP